MRKQSIAVACAVAMVILMANDAHAQNGKSTTSQGSSPNGRPFQALQSQLASIQQQLAGIESLQSQIDALATAVASHTASIDQLQRYHELQDQQIASLGGAVLALSTALTGVKADVQTLQLYRQTSTAWLQALDERWRQAEERLDGHAGDLQALVDADNALHALMAAIQQEITFLRLSGQGTAGDVAELQQDLAALLLELNAKQNLVLGSCPAGYAIRQIDAAGNVACEFDDLGSGGGSAGGTSTIAFNDGFVYGVVVPAGSSGYGFASCPTGYEAVSGGFSVPASFNVFYSVPGGALGWTVGAYNPTSEPESIYVHVRCVR